MDFSAAKKKLESIQQEKILLFWPKLEEKERLQLLELIDALDLQLFHKQQKLLKKRKKTNLFLPRNFSPVEKYSFRGADPENRVEGEKLLSQGAVGVLVLAGGHGSRLGYHAPKGCFPISVVKEKSLFQIFCEKTAAAQKKAAASFPIAFLCSIENIGETEKFFAIHNYFGLDPAQLFFFHQNDLPLLDTHGNLFLATPSQIASGPEGNGTALFHFVAKGIAEQWTQRGVKFVTVALIDNPLSDPFDAEFIGFHSRKEAEATIKCIERVDPYENIGLITQYEKSLRVVEYNEVPNEIKELINEKGKFAYRLGNISQFCFSIKILPKLAQVVEKMAMHLAFKASVYLDENGVQQRSSEAIAWKFERYIFDLLPWIKNSEVLVYPRSECFSPLKNCSGPKGPEEVKQALLAWDRAVIEKITGLPAPPFIFELDQQFHYPTEKLLAYWHKRPLAKAGYVEPFEGL